MVDFAFRRKHIYLPLLYFC